MTEFVSDIRDYSKGITKIENEFYSQTKDRKKIKAPPPEVSFAFKVNQDIAAEVNKLESEGGPSGVFDVDNIDNTHRDTLNAFADNLKDCHDELKKFDTRRFNFIFLNKAKLLESIRNHAEKMQQFFSIYRVSIETKSNPEIDFSVFIDDEGALDFWVNKIGQVVSIRYAEFVDRLREAQHDTTGIELKEYGKNQANIKKTKITPYTFNRIVRVCGGWPEFLARIKVKPQSEDENFIQKISNTNTRVSPTLIYSTDMAEAEPVKSEYPGQAVLGSIFFINRNGLLLSTENDEQDDGARVVAYVPLGSVTQQWILGEDGKITHSSSKLFLTATELREGCKITVVHDTKRDTQRWSFVEPGLIVSKANTNLALMVDDATFAVTLVRRESGKATPFKIVNFAPSMAEYDAKLDISKQPKFAFYTPEARAFLVKALSDKKGTPAPPAPADPQPSFPAGGPNGFTQPPPFDANQMPPPPPPFDANQMPPPPPFDANQMPPPPSFESGNQQQISRFNEQPTGFNPPPPSFESGNQQQISRFNEQPTGFGNPPPFQPNLSFNPPPFQPNQSFNPPPFGFN